MIKAFTIKNKHNCSVTILNLGGIIHEINVPDRNGTIENIVHGFKTIEEYKRNPAYFGAIIGRTGGRIAGGVFEINKKKYSVPTVDRGNALHGGAIGFDKRLWDVVEKQQSLILTYVSPDGEEGFPGEVVTTVTYTLTDDNQLLLEYDAISDQDTLLNLTNHTYFNLNPKSSILEMTLQVKSDCLLAINESSIPTGAMMPVEGTPFDFNQPKKIGQDIKSDHEQLLLGGGYDHPWVLRPESINVVLSDKKTGRILTMNTDQNAVVLYSYNFPIGQDTKHMGLAVEFQNDPDSIHHDHFSSCILRKGERYKQKTVYHFGLDIEVL